MVFVRPTLAKLISRAQSDIETRLPGADSRLRNSVESILARVVAGIAHSLHGHLVFLSKQLLPDTAESIFLRRWADIWGLEQIAAVKATGNINITGTNTTVCPAGTMWQDGDGLLYEQDSDATISGGSASVDITADLGGVDYNQVVGTTISLVTPVAGIDTDGTVDSSGITGGSDVETDANLLLRLQAVMQSPPKGGGPDDYVNWALEVAGTTRAWQYPNLDGLGTVGVRWVRDGETVITPTGGDITTMQTYLDAKAPVTAQVNLYAPTEYDLTLSITLNPSSTAIQNAIIAELEDLLLRVGEPGGTIYLSQINEAISLAPGEVDHTITLIAGLTPANVTVGANEIPVLGTITWS